MDTHDASTTKNSPVDDQTPQRIIIRRPTDKRSPLSQIRALQRKVLAAAEAAKCTPNTLAQLARSWVALEERRCLLSRSEESAFARSLLSRGSSKATDHISTAARGRAGVSFLESLPVDENEQPVFATRQAPTNPHPKGSHRTGNEGTEKESL